MANIYEMNAQIESLLDSMIDEDTGEVNEEALAQLEQLEADKDEKIKNTGLFIKNRMAFAEEAQTGGAELRSKGDGLRRLCSRR